MALSDGQRRELSLHLDDQIARARDEGRPQLTEMIDAVQSLSDTNISNMRRQTELGYPIDDRFVREWVATEAALRLLRLIKKHNTAVSEALRVADAKAKTMS